MPLASAHNIMRRERQPSSIPTDIPSISPSATPVSVAPSVVPTFTPSNVHVCYYHAPHWEKLPSDGLKTLTSFKEEMVETIHYTDTTRNFAGSGKSDFVAALFTAYLRFDTDGLASFCITSDDGSKLFVNDKMIVDNDGRHGAVRKCGSLDVLRSKLYKFEIDFFENAGGTQMIVEWKPPGASSYKVVPPEAWSTTIPTNSPTSYPEMTPTTPPTMSPTPIPTQSPT